MKKILMGLFLFTGMTAAFASGKNEELKTVETSNTEVKTANADEDGLKSWGCTATAYLLNSETGEYEPHRSFSICCFDTPEAACAAAVSELQDQMSPYN